MPVSFDRRSDSRTLLVAFGGMRGQIGMPPFEFFRATGSIAVKRLFVRDLLQAWYHRGVPGYGSGIADTAEALRSLIEPEQPERVVVAGNSAGGYAALAFGALLGADVSLAFAPQTVLDPDVLADWDDHRWDDQLLGLVTDGALDGAWTDLRSALPRAATGSTSYEVHFDESFGLDRAHAERLSGVDGVRLHPRAGGAHGIAREMRESGELEAILRQALRSCD